MKTYKKFKIHLVNGDTRLFGVKISQTLEEFLRSNWSQTTAVMASTEDRFLIPWHGVAMIEGVDDEGKEK